MNPNLPSSITKGDNYEIVGTYMVNGSSNGSYFCGSDKDGVVSNISELTTIGTHRVYCTASTGAKVNKTADTYITITYEPYTITNLITNGSFENGIDGWYNYDSTHIEIYNYENANFAKYGNKTLKVKQLLDCRVFLRANYPNTNDLQGHKVYAKVSTLRENTLVVPGIYLDFTSTSDDWSEPRSDIVDWYSIHDNNAGTWIDMSLYSDSVPYNYLKVMLAQSNGTNVVDSVFYFDGLIVIDLTKTFGSGNEPDKEWCDRHINYFDGYTTIYK